MITIIIKAALWALAFIIWTSYCYQTGEQVATKKYTARLEALLKQKEKHQ